MSLSAVRVWSSCLGCACALGLWWPAAAHAQVAIGPHGAVNLDAGHPHLGADVIVQVATLSPTVALGVWPSYAHVFIEDQHDVELISVDFPFMFQLEDGIVTPFAAPGLALSIQDGTAMRVNLIGGAFLNAGGGVRPFADLAIRVVGGVYVDLQFGVVFEL